jgi:tetratricopeptide (TPR) repeat protein
MTGEKKNDANGFVKKETFYTAICIAVVVGFFAGIVFSVFKSDSIPAVQKQSSQQTDQQGISQDDEARIIALEGQFALDPKNLQTIVELAHRYFDTGQHEKAISMYTKALELDHNNADIWTDLGVMYRRSKQPELAIEAFDHALEHNPQHEISRFNKGIVLLYDLKDKQGAIKAWQELLAVNPLAAAPNGLPLTELIKEIEKEG